MKEKNKTKKKNMPLMVFIILFLLVVLAGGGVLYYNNLLNPVDPNGEEVIVEIPHGYSIKNISDLLQKEGIIRKDLAFNIAVRLENLQSRLQSGRYLLSPSMSTQEIIYKIADGQVIDDSIRVTIPEGFELTMIAEKLEEKGLTTKNEFIQDTQDIDIYDYEFLKDIPENRDNPLEGYLFPDTYSFSYDVTNKEIIDSMLNRFDEIFKNEYYHRAKELDMTIDDIVIMGSLVEREAKHQEERALIAGVYYNRLDIGMKLQCDATVQYALGERKTRLLYSDLEIDSPYNTYKYYGLPIGPISSVGYASIEAALYPESSDYIYYVAKDDGSHVFTKTLDEHNEAKRQVLNY